MKKKSLSFILACLMILMQIPLSALADIISNEPPTDENGVYLYSNANEDSACVHTPDENGICTQCGKDVRPPKLSRDKLSDAKVGGYYGVYIYANDTPTPVTFELVTSETDDTPYTLPSGLSGNAYDDCYEICGVPTVTGTYTFTLKATNEYGTTKKTYTLNINEADPLEIRNSKLDNATVGIGYRYGLSVNLSLPTVWELAEGSELPSGLYINYEYGSIEGTPEAAGRYTFTVTASCAGQTASKELTLIVLEEGGCKHTEMVLVEGTQPTCQRDGTLDYYHCNTCECDFSDISGINQLWSKRDLVSASYHSDKNADSICDFCDKPMPIFKKVTAEKDIMVGGVYVFVTEIDGRYYALAQPPETENEDSVSAGKEYGDLMPLCEITPNDDGTFEFNALEEQSVMMMQTTFAAESGNLDAGMPRYGLNAVINNIRYGLSDYGAHFWVYPNEPGKYGYRIKLNEDNAAVIGSVYKLWWNDSEESDNGMLRAFDMTYNGENTKFLTLMEESYFNGENGFYNGAAMTRYPIYLYKMTDCGMAGDKIYTAADAQSMVDISAVPGVFDDYAGMELSNVSGLTNAVSGDYIANAVSSAETEETTLIAETYAQIAAVASESEPDENGKETITSLTYSVTPYIRISDLNGNVAASNVIADEDLNGAGITVTLHTGGVYPQQVIHYKNDGTNEYFYDELLKEEWNGSGDYPNDSDNNGNGSNSYSYEQDDKGNGFVTITVSSLSQIKILANAEAEEEYTKYSVTVTDGKASVDGTDITKAAKDTIVTLTANEPESGKEFDKWVVESGDITLADEASAATEFTMPAGEVRVKATYKDIPEYTVTYDAGRNGGTIRGESTSYELARGGTDIIPGNNNTAEREGYEFLGWNTDPNAEEGLSSYKLTGDVTLYPIFVKTVAVRLYCYGGTDELYEYVNIYNNNTTGTMAFPTVDDTGAWTFEGWTSNKDSSEAEYKANGTADISENTDYYAVYSREITLTYVTEQTTSEGSQTESHTLYMNAGGGIFAAKVKVPAAPEKTGYSFTGWRSQDNYQRLVPANGTVEVYEDTVFAAEWTAAPLEEYTVTYDYATNGGDSASAAESKVKYNSLADLTPTAAKNGYEFVGWHTDKNAHEALSEYAVTENTTLYAIFKKTVSLRFYSRNGMIQTRISADLYNNETNGVVEVPEATSYKGWTSLGWRNDSTAAEPKVYGAEMEFSEKNTNFYAVYSREITLSYDKGNGTTESDAKTQYFNSAGNTSEIEFTLAAAPTKNTDEFVAWAIGSKDGEKHQPGEVIKASESMTVYAVWESDTIVKYTVTYDYTANGGTYLAAESDKVSVNSGDKADLSVTASKDTYDFVGWNTDKNAAEAMTTFTVNEDVTLYAVYKKTVMVQFMEEANKVQSVEYAVLYNNADTAVIKAPEPVSKDGWSADGWRSDEQAAPAEYKSGTVRISNDTYFYPVYKRFITLSYDVNGGNGTIKPDTALQYMSGCGNVQAAAFTLAAPPQKSGYSFTSWNVSADPARGYQGGETVTLTENATATASWTEIQTPAKSVSVTYDYTANGGTRTTKAYDTVESGAKADLTPVAAKAGYEFVGWNTDKDAKTALTEYTVTKDTTLYAIYKRNVTAKFYSGENTLQETISRTLFNNENTAVIAAPVPDALDGWTAVGWRDNKHALENEYRSGDITISEDTDFYAIYSRDITVSETAAEGEGASTISFSQYRNAAGGMESKTVMLEEPEPREGYRFRGWAVGDETGKRYKPGTAVSVSESMNLVGLWVKLPEGDVSLPSVQTGAASVSSPTSATISAQVESDGGDAVIERGFVYWSKLNSESKYTVLTSGDAPCAISNLSPDTEYYYYAFAENAAGTGKGYIKSFATASDDNPNALMITPEYVSVEKDGVYQLLATLLPASAKNRKIVWSSSDESVVTVDGDGKIKAIKKGQAVITATTEVDRLTAECIVDVTETEEIKEYNFSEWNMATNTSNYAKDGLGFDWDTSNYGGNHQMATAYLARWDGAVLDENDPYPEFNDNPSAGYKKLDADYHIQDVEWLPAREDPLDNDEIKSALMEYGAVYTLFNIDWAYFDDNYLNYYCPVELDYGGHCVTIVGWDDNYSKSNFVSEPPGNGAFLCKNSWGEDVGDRGCFYISYYDAQMGRMDSNAVVTGFEKNSNYNKIYQYDPLGAVGYIGFEDTTYAANVFPEKGKTLSQDEALKAVSFYTYHKNTSYDVYIVTDYKDSASLSKLWTPAATGVIKNSGYHTVNLKTPVSLKAGTRFAVVVKLDTPGELSYVYCEYPAEGYSSNARANADESYYSADGGDWWDLTEDVDNANFCIKAFTDNGLALSSAELFSGIDNAGREYENDAVYTLSQAVENGLPVNDDYIDYIDRMERSSGQVSLMSDDEKSMGSVPSITKAGANSVTFTDGAIFPSSYDLRTMGLVSSIKDQGQWGTCWAHTMYASLESNILKQMKTTNSSAESGNIPTEMTLSRGALTMTPGSSITLAKKITPVGAANKAVVWISSDESVATVDTNGTIRAVGGGSANISAATVSGGICAQCSVVVEEQDIPETISLEDRKVTKSVGDVFMVAYSVTPMRSASSSLGWISDNANVAAVNENGVITAMAEGTAQISVISDKGEIKDSVTVVVGSGFNCAVQSPDDSGLTFADNKLSGSVTVTINNNAASEQDSKVILAVYDSNNVMTGMTSVSKKLSPGANTVQLSDIAFDGIQAGSYTLRCFVWDSLTGAMPLSEAADKQLVIN